MRWFVTLFATVAVVSGCTDDSVIEVGGEISPGLIVDASIKRKAEPFHPGKVKIVGRLAVVNISNQPVPYSNRRLRLNIDRHTAERTNVDSPASHIVDIGDVDIEPGEILEFHAYWVLPESIGKSWSDGNVSLSFSQ